MGSIDIYEELARMDAELKKLMVKVEKYETYFVDEDRKAELDLEDDLEGFYTVNDILRKYSISRQTLHKYRKLAPLKKSTKIGRFDRFNKNKVVEFMTKIIQLKQTNPELFKVDFKKAS